MDHRHFLLAAIVAFCGQNLHPTAVAFVADPWSGSLVRRNPSKLPCSSSEEQEVALRQWPDGLSPTLTTLMKDELQITAPNWIQVEALESALKQQDVVVIGQTGSGKTMAYLLPMLQQLEQSQDARCLVLAPNDLLVQQHFHVAKKLDSRDFVQRIDCFTPSQFRVDWNYTIVALDEVDAILYGRDDDDNDELTPQGLELLQKLQHSAGASPTQFILTTAYLSPAREKALLDRDFPAAVVVRDNIQGQMGWMVPTLRQVYKYFSSNKSLQLERVLQNARNDDWLRGGSAIVFCGAKETARDVFHAVAQNINCTTLLLLHDDMTAADRTNVLEDLRKAGKDITITLICTDLAARGLDIDDVRHVILYDVPRDLSTFVHQAGRTARRGKQGLLTCLVKTHSSEMGRYTKLHTLKDASKLTFQ